MSQMLACGPYFAEDGFVGSIILFLLVKPLAYFAFIQAFRYRVSPSIPMRFSQAAQWAVLRAMLGLMFITAGAFVLFEFNHDRTLWQWSWVYLYGERVFSWWVVGRYGAVIRGRRLVGWVISGVLINTAFDAAMVLGLIEGAAPQIGIVTGIAVFIAILHVVGRRESLKKRFSGLPICASCGYNLTGNLSGRCPDCGTAVKSATFSLS